MTGRFSFNWKNFDPSSPDSVAVVSTLIVACAFFMEAIDANIIVTALPAMARGFGKDPVALKIAVTSYVVSLGVFIPVCGWLADRFSARAVFRTAIGIFVAGSLMCAASPSLHLFTFARFIQGIGGALMVPVGRIIVVRAVPKHLFIRAMNYLSITWVVGPILAPLLGGFIATYLHWRMMFLINVPVGILGIYLSGNYIANTKEAHPGAFDWAGSVLSASGATLVLLGLSLVGSGIIEDFTAWEMFIAGAILLAIYVLHARRATHPVLDLRFFDIPTFRASVLGGSLFRIGCGAIPFLLPLSLQVGLGKSAFESGLITCATAFGSLFMRPLMSMTLRRFGFRQVLLYNAVFSAITTSLCAFFTPGSSTLTIWLIVLVGGFFSALQFSSLNSMLYADIPGASVGRATSLGSVVQQVSLGLAVAVSGIVLQISRALHGHAQVEASDFWPAFLIAGLFALGSIPLIYRLPANAGDEMARAKAKS
ncbi:MFS transporter [Paraburkholderia silvatlantica]|uniref:EmrB/QacA subfamily drug resistance transporter n=1 Tax=Paraburkholderia silvatlantica TaxID=321895 RepID=A0A2U1ACA0_9BURK|nr:MFS transporter [Paraburkholderia silvatlantica]MBB2925732.1 EmrB/QacA subfamily drug resistance transporter [Paraburkholderia silvatlantica]PVY33152.1 EmrB/QacA subfamily drug resistance transporter [Paraburkholderia silvatlantica]PXW38044.1 EmrB/QacA subfamily drug resistance transporter [Paraburkholderia silvatlantica]PYE28020.1 EmrB/QacA subfamily drug resistance transporter [Paraburkholderia silvatlantica]TDQ92573.1 EmrB/QacA subfamily drug resistance transporter [Paraburkholderia silv